MKRTNKRKTNYEKSKQAQGAEFGMIRTSIHSSKRDYDRKKIKLNIKREFGC